LPRRLAERDDCDAAIGLAEQIRAASDEIERGRRIPPGIAAAMKASCIIRPRRPGLEVRSNF
jgi:hypothetical protein